jgi:hypothetical protein
VESLGGRLNNGIDRSEGVPPRPYIFDRGAIHVDMITMCTKKIVNYLSLSSYGSADLSSPGSVAWGLQRGKAGSLLWSLAQRSDLTIHWALGPFVRSFILLVDPGDICPPQAPDLWVDFEVISPKIPGPACR